LHLIFVLEYQVLAIAYFKRMFEINSRYARNFNSKSFTVWFIFPKSGFFYRNFVFSICCTTVCSYKKLAISKH
jgi:hypothetical protein